MFNPEFYGMVFHITYTIPSKNHQIHTKIHQFILNSISQKHRSTQIQQNSMNFTDSWRNSLRFSVILSENLHHWTVNFPPAIQVKDTITGRKIEEEKKRDLIRSESEKKKTNNNEVLTRSLERIREGFLRLLTRISIWNQVSIRILLIFVFNSSLKVHVPK